MEASRDQNHVPGTLAVLNTDTVQGTNLVPIKIAAEALKVTDTDSISFTMVPVGAHDQNYVNVLLLEGTDGLLYPAVANSDGALLIDI